jgi:cytochrome c oxidase subunit II
MTFPATLSPSSPVASAIAWLSSLNLAAGMAVWIVVLLALSIAVGRQWGDQPAGQRGKATAVSVAVVLTVLGLLGLAFASYATDRRVTARSAPAVSAHIEGRQYWWRITYGDSASHRRVTTANELVIPAGQPVSITLGSADVIHSFWPPELHGKVDLTPGYTSAFILSADTAGVYQGSCAEFCGMQHAKMRFRVVALPPDRFSEWYENESRPAAPPTDSVTARGQEVLLTSSCGLCHTVRGTAASGTTGPDLTHLASRSTIASGTLPNTRGHLGGWILDPQRIKPGTQMPRSQLEAGDLNALLAYLLTLK